VELASIIGDSAVMREVREWIEGIAPTDLDVLITGETGTGKELVARAIHYLSGLTVFRAVNVAALAPNLLESALFGHLKGSFTGAHCDKRGLFAAAHGGTLFLDEIGELPLELQVKLLRALEYGEIIPVGADEVRHVQVRVISATNLDLEEAVRKGRFRQDLYWRLKPARVHVPTLRAREGDVALLARHFAGGRRILPDAMMALETHLWPGNVRELKSALRYAVQTGGAEHIRVQDLPPDVRRQPDARNGGPAPIATLREVEEAYIVRVIDLADGDNKRAAKLLGIDVTTLRRRLTRINHASDD
jgi:two-component system response regulator AtoC